MSVWWRDLWNDPIRDNPWALGLLVLFGLVWFGPPLVMMGRDMFRKRREMNETREPQPEATHAGEADMAEAQRLPAVDAVRPSDAEIDDAQTQQWKTEGIPDVSPFAKGGPISATAVGRYRATTTVPRPLVSTERIECEHCKGVGYLPGINDLLVESLNIVGANGDDVVRQFYTTLLAAAPTLAPLFPADLTEPRSDANPTPGQAQRDRLLAALAALSDLYDPSVPGKMDRLDQALERFGRSHAAFVRPDGTIKGATMEEYAAVKTALFATLVRFGAEQWRPEFSEAWSQAYDYAAGKMIVEQIRSGFSAPRFARS